MRKFNLTLLTCTLCGFLALHAGEEEISSSQKHSQTEEVTENSDPSLACNDEDQSSSHSNDLGLATDEEEADVTSTVLINNLASNEVIEENEEESSQTV